MLQAADLTIRLHAEDDVVIARVELPAGHADREGERARRGGIPAGHKVAVRAVAKGQPVRRYHQIIGFATQPIAPGDHVHVHNVAMGDFERDYAFCRTRSRPICAEPATFMGSCGRRPRRDAQLHRHPDQRELLGDRRAHDRRSFPTNRLDDYPNVDGVVALTHKTGCGMASDGEATDLLRRTIAGYARHPNFFSSQLVGLGCEANQINVLLAAQQLKQTRRLRAFTIQDKGGTRKTVRDGIARVEGDAAGGEPGEARAGAGEPS